VEKILLAFAVFVILMLFANLLSEVVFNTFDCTPSIPRQPSKFFFEAIRYLHVVAKCEGWLTDA
jgi:hypothetical protein